MLLQWRRMNSNEGWKKLNGTVCLSKKNLPEAPRGRGVTLGEWQGKQRYASGSEVKITKKKAPAKKRTTKKTAAKKSPPRDLHRENLQREECQEECRQEESNVRKIQDCPQRLSSCSKGGEGQNQRHGEEIGSNFSIMAHDVHLKSNCLNFKQLLLHQHHFPWWKTGAVQFSSPCFDSVPLLLCCSLKGAEGSLGFCGTLLSFLPALFLALFSLEIFPHADLLGGGLLGSGLLCGPLLRRGLFLSYFHLRPRGISLLPLSSPRVTTPSSWSFRKVFFERHTVPLSFFHPHLEFILLHWSSIGNKLVSLAME